MRIENVILVELGFGNICKFTLHLLSTFQKKNDITFFLEINATMYLRSTQNQFSAHFGTSSVFGQWGIFCKNLKSLVEALLDPNLHILDNDSTLQCNFTVLRSYYEFLEFISQ